jgi:hypothetical protein
MNQQEINTFLKENNSAYLFIETQSFTKYQVYQMDGIFYLYRKCKGERKFHKISITAAHVAPIVSFIKAYEIELDSRYSKIREGINLACFKSSASDKSIGEYFNSIN